MKGHDIDTDEPIKRATMLFNFKKKLLQRKTEWYIEVEMETKCYCGHTNHCECEELEGKPFTQRPKITNNQIKILKIK